MEKMMAVRKTKAMVSVADQMAADAQKEYENEKTGGGGSQISIRGGEFKLNGEALGDEMNVVVVANAFEHAYYDSPFNADDPQPPACFALGEDEDELAPDPSSPAPQAETCADCWANEWGSSDTGRGKACKNSRRLVLLAVGDDGAVHMDDMPVLKVPPASLRNYSGFAKRSTKVTQRPTYGLVTTVGFDANAEYETLTFNLADKVGDDYIAAVLEKRDAALETALEPFDTSNYKSPDEVKASRRRGAATKPAVKKKVTVKKKVGGRSKMS